MYLPGISFARIWQLPLMICKAFPDGGFQLLTFFILHCILTVAVGAYSLTSLRLAVLISSVMDVAGFCSSFCSANMSSWLNYNETVISCCIDATFAPYCHKVVQYVINVVHRCCSLRLSISSSWQLLIIGQVVMVSDNLNLL